MAECEKQNGKLKVVFMGSDILSCTFLGRLVHSPGVKVCAVITQPDKARGRSLAVVSGPVKDLALLHVIPVFAPPNVNAPEILNELAQIQPDLIVVMAYGQFLGKDILASARLGCINLHVSLLPKYRGAAPIQHAIMNGETETGVTAIMLSRKMDAGDILGSVTRKIKTDDTFGTLGLELAKEGADLMLDIVRQLGDGICARVQQDESQATFAHKIDENLTPAIDWNNTAPQIERLVRAMNPKPCCHAYLPGRDPDRPFMPGLRIKVIETKIVRCPAFNPVDQPPGTVISMRGNGPVIATGGGGAICLTRVHVEGKKEMDGKAFSNGYANKLAVGEIMRSGA